MSNTRTRTILERQDRKNVSSKVLNEMAPDDLPTSETACQVCPHVLWLEQKEESKVSAKAYCRVMNTIIWSPEEPVDIINCDGLILGQEEDEEEMY